MNVAVPDRDGREDTCGYKSNDCGMQDTEAMAAGELELSRSSPRPRDLVLCRQHGHLTSQPREPRASRMEWSSIPNDHRSHQHEGDEQRRQLIKRHAPCRNSVS